MLITFARLFEGTTPHQQVPRVTPLATTIGYRPTLTDPTLVAGMHRPSASFVFAAMVFLAALGRCDAGEQGTSLLELDGASFAALLAPEDVDAFVCFYRNETSVEAALSAVDRAAHKLGAAGASGIRVATFDHGQFGMPVGMHVSSNPHCILFPAGDRDPRMYAWETDDWSFRAGNVGGSTGGSRSPDSEDGHDHGDEHSHPHEHASHHHNHAPGETCSHNHHAHDDDSHRAHAPGAVLSEFGILAFLKQHASFPLEVPTPSLADRWRGKDLFRALGEGLEAVRQQYSELQAENSELRGRLAVSQARVAALQRQEASRGSDGGSTTCHVPGMP